VSGAGAQPQQQADVDAARAGDEDAFRRLVEPYRPELHAHCYRMLGSLHDADDAMQDALVRAWRGLSSFQGDRPIRPWLYRIATNACLDLIAKRPKRLLPADQGPPSDPGEGAGSPVREPIWLEPYPDEELPAKDPRAAPDSSYEVREGVELAFIAALQHLPAKQRAALILREVLGLSAREAAEALGTSVAAVNSALQRARKAVAERVPARSQQTTLRDLGDDGLREAVRRYISAWERRDVDAMVAILAEDATFAMPPMPSWWQGRDAVVGFIVGTGVPRLRSIVTSANGQPAVAWYVWNGEREVYAAASLEVLGFEGDLVREITAFVMPELFPRFGLPAEL
jgi:RNA polymerase sigma-70 factor, ECF subfamily